ncbi:MAG: sigma-E processing peptidase SpoIIGA, partial [Christensenellales bacterium]
MTLSSALLALHILYAVRRKRMFTWEVRVSLCFQGKSIRFPALIDTGNRLREPMSGLPVLIAEASLLDGLLGGELAPGLTRQVAFGGLGGCGTVRCFHPDHV